MIGVTVLLQEAAEPVNVKPVILLDALPILMTNPFELTVTVPLASTVIPIEAGIETLDPHEAVHEPATTTISPVVDALIAACTSASAQEAALRVVAHDGVDKTRVPAMKKRASRFANEAGCSNFADAPENREQSWVPSNNLI
jgi:hypothetical protein